MSVTYDLAEAIADAAITYIKSAQTAKLAVVEARYATAMGLTDMTVRLGDVYQGQEPGDAYPVLYVSPVKTALEPGPGGLLRGAVATHTVTFLIVAYRPDLAGEMPAESLKRALMRYAAAVIEMLIEGQAADSWGWEWGTGATTQVQYRTFQAPSAYLGVAAIEATVVAVEVA